MRRFQEKKRWQMIFLSRPALVLLFIGVLFFAWSVLGLLGKMAQTGRDNELAAARVAELDKRRTELSGEIERLESPAGVEESIREKYGWALPGEGVIIIVDDKKNEETEPQKSEGLWGWLKSLFD